MSNDSGLLGYSPGSVEQSYGTCRIVHSGPMNRDLPILVFLPASYQSDEKPYRVCYLLHGAGGKESPLSEEMLRKVYGPESKLQEIADVFRIIIVTPIVGNSLYVDSTLKENSKFATYTGKELPEFVDANYRTLQSREGRILAGFSMGGYGAVSLMCRYPDTFSVALSRGGLFDLAFGIRDFDWDDGSAVEIFGSYWQNMELYHSNGCYNLINHIRHRKDCAIVLEVGMDDFLYNDNQHFHEKLMNIKMPHIYAEYPTGHAWGSECVITLLSHYTSLSNNFFSQ